MTDEMIAVGTIPLNPNVLDFADAEGKIILYVRDEEQGRSVYLSVSMYGELTRTYEVRYDDFAEVITRMMGKVTMHNVDDPFAQLLLGGSNGD